MSHPLAQRIGDVTRRARRAAFWESLGWLLAVTLGVAVALMAIDYTLRLSDRGMRWLSSGLLLAALAAAAYHWLGAGGWRRYTPLSVAQLIQRKRPGLGSRLASAVEFLGQETDDPTAGSADLRRSVVAQASADVDAVELGDVIDRRPLRYAMRALAACVVAAMAFALADPTGFRTAGARLVAPWSDASWPRRNYLQFVEAPDRIARGQSFEATLRDAGGDLPDDARVLYRTRVGGEDRVEEQPVRARGGESTVARQNVRQSFAYRAVGGDDHTMRWRTVEVVDPPQLTSLRVTATPPAYTGLPPRDLGEEDRVLDGTRVEVEGRTGTPVRSASLEVTTPEQSTELALNIVEGDAPTESILTLPDAPWNADAGDMESAPITYRVRLEGPDGLRGAGEPRRLRVESDPVPAVEWLEPAREALVTADAVVPVRVLAEDNLALQRVDLFWRPDTLGEEEADDSPLVGQARLHEGPAEPPARSDPHWNVPAESRELSHVFDLSELAVEAGDRLSLMVEAADYRPGVGRTPLPRRVTILSVEEFDSRLAQAQSALMQHLQRLLKDQREARQGASELEIERRNDAELSRATVDRLTALGFEQRQIGEGVSDPERGAAARADELLQELADNRLDRPELKEQLNTVRSELRRLADGPLPAASRSLADAQRDAVQAVEDGAQQAAARVGQSLATAGGEQDEVVQSLEELIGQMSDWSDYQQFAQELAELEGRQRELRQETAREAARAAAEGRNEPARKAAREKLAAAQGEVARRFSKLQESMRRAANRQEGEADTSDQALEDALAEAETRATAGKFDQAARQLSEGKLGRSTQQQQSGAEDLREMLDILRDRAASNPDQLADQLRDAQQKLAQLQSELEDLQQRANQEGEQQPRQELGDDTDRLARRLNRLDAPQAGQSTQQGAGQMQQAAQQGRRAAPSLQQAEQDLQRAQQQLAQRIEQLEQEQAQRVLDRLANQMDGFIETQTEVLDGTVRVDQETQAGIEPQESRDQIERLADEQEQLREAVEEARRMVAEREVFELALRGAVTDMDDARRLLTDQRVGRQTQQREYSALSRLKHVADALKLNPPEPNEQNQQNQGGQGGQGGQPQGPSPVDVAELKMLRLMQLELNARTRDLEADAVEGLVEGDAASDEAGRLSSEQERLAELVRELMARNNERQENPGGPPDDAT